MTPTERDTIRRFVAKFDCCANQIKVRGLIPSWQHWNLRWAGDRFKLGAGPATNPLAILLDNVRGFDCIYHQRLSGFLNGQWPYHQLNSLLGFKGTELSGGFKAGFWDNYAFENVYFDDVSKTMFDIGRYLLNRHCGILHPYSVDRVKDVLR